LFVCRPWRANLVAFAGEADINSWVEFNGSVENDPGSLLCNARLAANVAAARSVSASPVAVSAGCHRAEMVMLPRRTATCSAGAETAMRGGRHDPVSLSPFAKHHQNVANYFFLPEAKVGCQAEGLRFGAAAITLFFSFLGFLASRLLLC